MLNFTIGSLNKFYDMAAKWTENYILLSIQLMQYATADKLFALSYVRKTIPRPPLILEND